VEAVAAVEDHEPVWRQLGPHGLAVGALEGVAPVPGEAVAGPGGKDQQRDRDGGHHGRQVPGELAP
jgi:hypothetical protein